MKNEYIYRIFYQLLYIVHLTLLTFFLTFCMDYSKIKSSLCQKMATTLIKIVTISAGKLSERALKTINE